MRDIFPIDLDFRLNFSGHKEGPKAYKKWQKAMEDWFFVFSIPKHHKVRCAEETLKGEARKWWKDELKMVDYYGEPDHSWSSMRFLMFEEFVMSAASQEQSNQVSRTKLFEEGEYDIGRKSTKTSLEPVIQPREEDGPMIIGDVTKSAEQTPEPHSTHNDVNINVENSSANLSTISGHVESPSKWNQAILSSYEKDVNFTSHESCKTSGLDQHALFEEPRPNQDDSSCKPACSGILTQKGSCETSNQTKPKSEHEDIQVTSQPDSDFVELDLPTLIGQPRSEESEFSYQSSCCEILTHKGRSETLNHINQSFNEGVMDFSSQCHLHLPYLEAHEFGRFQQSDWRPEDYLNDLDASKNTPRCILIHWILGIQSLSSIHQDIPFQATRASIVITCNQLFPTTHGRPRMLLGWSQIVPRHSSYGPKLTRLKAKNRRFRF